VVLILFVGLNLLSPVFMSLFPKTPDPALVAFGKLPAISFENGIKPPSDVIYKIETVSGDLKEQKSKLKVFEIGKTDVKFGDMSRVNGIAQALQFPTPPILVTNDSATYQDKTDKNKTLQIGILTKNFILKSDYLNNTDLIANLEKNEEANKQGAIALLKSLGINQAYYPPEKITLVKYKIDGGKLSEVLTLATTNLERVNFAHADIDKIPVVYTKYQEPKINVLAANGRVLAANVNAADIQLFRFSTYPTRGIAQAFEDLKAGKAIYNKDLNGKTFNIRDLKMAYLDTDTNESFLQPVYVFVGDDGLEAYVRAISDNYIKGD